MPAESAPGAGPGDPVRRSLDGRWVLASCLVVGLWAWADQRLLPLTHGLQLTLTSLADRSVLVEAVEPIPQLPSDTRLRALALGHWPQGKPVPAEVPLYLASWRGTLEAPAPVEGTPSLAPGLVCRLFPHERFCGPALAEHVVPGPRLRWHPTTVRPCTTPVGLEWRGFLEAREAGRYEFALESDDGAWLWVNDRAVVEDPPDHAARRREGWIELTSGRHAFTLRLVERGGEGLLSLRWRPPGEPEAEIPPERFSHLTAPLGGYALTVKSGQPHRLLIDGELILSDEDPRRYAPALSPGPHQIELQVVGGGELVGSDVRLSWRTPFDRDEPIPAAAVTPLGGGGVPWRWVIGLLLLLGLGGAGELLRRRGRLGAVRAVLARQRTALLIGLTLGASFAVRLEDYEVYPLQFETIDEFNNAWIGYGLLTRGVPFGWTWQEEGFEVLRPVEFFGEHRVLQEPVLHPPPTMGLLVGGTALLCGAQDPLNLPLRWLRIPSLLLGVWTTWLVFALGRRLFGERVALLGALFHAVLPLAVLIGRFAKEDALLAPAFLACMCATIDYLRDGRRRDLLLAGAAGFLALLAKESGVSVLAAWHLLLLRAGRREALRTSIPLALGALALPVAIGLLIDPGHYLASMRYHGAMNTRLTNVLELFSQSWLSGVPFGVGWQVWLWLCLALTLPRRGGQTLALMLVPYVVLLAVSVNQGAVYPWYRLPLLPLLCLAAAVVSLEAWRRPSLLVTTAFLLTAGYACLELLFDPGLVSSPGRMRALTVVALLPASLHAVWETPATRRLARLAWVGLVLGSVLLSLRVPAAALDYVLQRQHAIF